MCTCGKAFNLDFAISATKGNIEIYKSQAQDRLKLQMQTYCAMCRTNVSKKETHFPKLNIVPDQTGSGIHTLCKGCLLTLKGDIMKLSREGKINKSTKTVPINCLICNNQTHQVELKDLKPYLKGGDGGCCFIL